MSLAVVGETSLIQCIFGTLPTPLTVLPDRTVFAEFMLMANITDMVPLLNILPFDECTSLANPLVLSATIAAAGILQPQPCFPVIVDPWLTEALDVIVTEGPALDQTATIMCTWAGVIHIDEPGNFTVSVP